MAKNRGAQAQGFGWTDAQWIARTGVAPAPGVPFPYEAFPRFARTSYRALWNEGIKKRESGAVPEWAQYYDSRNEYLAARRANAAWSKAHSKQAMSKWSTKMGPEQTAAYAAAYTNDPWQALGATPGKRKGSPWHKYYVVDIGGFMSDAEYDSAYPIRGF